MQGKEDQILVTSFDGNPDACIAVENGELKLSVLTGSRERILERTGWSTTC